MSYCRNIGTWGRVWRSVVGLALAVACSAAMAMGDEPPAAAFVAAIGGALLGAFMLFEGTMRWCVLKSPILPDDPAPESSDPSANVH